MFFEHISLILLSYNVLLIDEVSGALSLSLIEVEWQQSHFKVRISIIANSSQDLEIDSENVKSVDKEEGAMKRYFKINNKGRKCNKEQKFSESKDKCGPGCCPNARRSSAYYTCWK